MARGLLGAAGYRVGFGRFARDGVLVAFIALLAATIWLLVRYQERADGDDRVRNPWRCRQRAFQLSPIQRARERGDGLVFLCVADASFPETIAAPVVVDVEAELEQMGRFQFAVAREQAAEYGVDAKVAIRRGDLLAELIRAARELGATLIVLGHPQGRTAVSNNWDPAAPCHHFAGSDGGRGANPVNVCLRPA